MGSLPFRPVRSSHLLLRQFCSDPLWYWGPRKWGLAGFQHYPHQVFSPEDGAVDVGRESPSPSDPHHRPEMANETRAVNGKVDEFPDRLEYSSDGVYVPSKGGKSLSGDPTNLLVGHLRWIYVERPRFKSDDEVRECYLPLPFQLPGDHLRWAVDQNSSVSIEFGCPFKPWFEEPGCCGGHLLTAPQAFCHLHHRRDGASTERLLLRHQDRVHGQRGVVVVFCIWYRCFGSSLPVAIMALGPGEVPALRGFRYPFFHRLPYLLSPAAKLDSPQLRRGRRAVLLPVAWPFATAADFHSAALVHHVAWSTTSSTNLDHSA
ncbi:hypothetical protein J5N97_025399 [Dioscorea zingiberensis]|uniref:Uncharacterized protein n=1 Tax=Dioscorea zingiberensis TaxID=325984 RepID=A0A9D5C874_9LILI|nr:hypothetical protein J5N97_025399 [Dioscorea zingiberensis]